MPRSIAPTLSYISLGTVGLMFILPFLQPYHRYPLVSFYSEWLAFVLGIAALVPFARKQAWQDMRLPVAALFPMGLIALLILQCLLDRVPYAGQAMLAAIYLVWAALLILLGALLRRQLGMNTIVIALAWCVLVGGELSAVAGVLQYYDISSFLNPLVIRSYGKAFGNLGQPNHYAAYLMFGLASAVYLFASGRMRGIAAVVCAAPLVFALGLSMSRSAWLYLGTALVLALLLRMRNADEKSRRLVVSMGLLVLGFILDQWLMTLPLFAPAAFAPAELHFSTATERIFAVPGISIKVEHARRAWWAFTQAPLLGVGWGQFAWYDFEFKALFGVRHASEPFNHSHNLVTQLLAETGLAGTLLITGGALLWLWDLRKARFDLEHWWLLALVATLGIHSLLEYPLWHAYFLGMAAIALGIGATRFVTLGLQRMGHLVALLVISVGAVNALSLLYSYRGFERLFTQKPAMPDARQLDTILSQAYRDPVLEPYAELTASFGITVDRDNLREKLESNHRVMHFAPIDEVVYRQALLLAMNGESEAALRQFERAMRVYPGELQNAIAKLRELVVKHPDEFKPLLESAIAKSR